MITVENISLLQGSFELSGIDFELTAGEYGVLMGRSGCGKTTVLEAICGLGDILNQPPLQEPLQAWHGSPALEALPDTLSPELNPNCSKTGPLTIANGLMQLVVA